MIILFHSLIYVQLTKTTLILKRMERKNKYIILVFNQVNLPLIYNY